MSTAPESTGRERRPDRLALLEALLRDEGLSAGPSMRIPRRATQSPAALSFGQERLWFLDQLLPGTPLYTIDLQIQLGSVDVAALERALNELVRRHEALRTTFRDEQGQPVQIIAPEMPLTLRVIDCLDSPDSHDPADRAAQAAAHAAREAEAPFDLARGPLFRALLIRVHEDDSLLILSVHHIVSDGWSMDVLMRELALVYDAYGRDEPSPLDPLPLQFADYATWQRQQFQGAQATRELQYWRERLSGLPVCALTTDRPRRKVASIAGATQGLVLSGALAASLRELTTREDATLFMSTLSALALLLQRYTGQDDVVLGTAVTGRHAPELEGLVGFFVNNLVLRLDLAGDPDFRELLRRVRLATLEAFAHQDMPFEKLVEDLKPARDTTHTPLFQIMFAFQQDGVEGTAFDDAFWNEQAIVPGTAKFELTFSIIASGDAIGITVEYNTDLFAHASMRRLLQRYAHVLEQVLAQPDAPVSQASCLDEQERRRLLVEWNATTRDFARDACVHEAVRAMAEAHADRLALSETGAERHAGGQHALSYGDLLPRATRLAAVLHGHGVGAGAIVPIVAPRSLDLAVAQLAVLMCGGAFAPFDPQSTGERVARVVAGLRSPVLLTVSSVRSAVGRMHDRVLVLDERLDAEGVGHPPLPVSARVSPDRPAYVIFTSGSTGRPKGVVISHRAVMNLAAWHQRTYAMTPHDRSSWLASPAFDASVWELWPSLIAGASVHVITNETRDDPDRLWQALAEQSITLAFMPTPLAELALERPLPASLALRALLVGGDRLHRAPGHDVPFALFNHYGPTESAVVTTAGRVDAGADPGAGDDAAAEASPHIGRPIDNTRVYVLDPHLIPVPPGVPGELFIGGEGLALGYLDDPERTAERFISSSLDPGGRLYASGDLVRFRDDGQLEFLGRRDEQVKIRGYRIEPGEIETVLLQHPAIHQAAVVSRASDGDARLVAYVTAHDARLVDDEALRRYVQERLPDYMVPWSFVVLDALPFTSNGKLDRQRLPPPRARVPTTVVGPQSDLEQRIRGIWREVLELDEVSTTINFFDLGGHSLLLVKLQARLRAMLDRPVAIVDLFRHPTIVAQAAWLSSATPPRARTLADVRSRAEKLRHGIAQHAKTGREESRDG